MDIDGYPDDFELEKIKNWDFDDAFNLIKYLKQLLTYDDAIVEKWSKEKDKMPVLYLEIHTCGWSGNEDIIKALLKNEMFNMWYTKWERGGHYYFEVRPINIRFETLKEIARRKNVTKQIIHHNKNNYDWIVIGKKTMLCREKSD